MKIKATLSEIGGEDPEAIFTNVEGQVREIAALLFKDVVISVEAGE